MAASGTGPLVFDDINADGNSRMNSGVYVAIPSAHISLINADKHRLFIVQFNNDPKPCGK